MEPMSEDRSAEFRAAMRAFASTVTIISTSDGHRHHGMTATSVTSLSMDPPSLLICVNQNSLLHEIMFQARHFVVNVLQGGQEHIAAAFGGKASPAERFACGAWEFDEGSMPYLKEAQSIMLCRKAAAIPYGTHTILVGVVETVRRTAGAQPLVYSDGGYCSLENAPERSATHA